MINNRDKIQFAGQMEGRTTIDSIHIGQAMKKPDCILQSGFNHFANIREKDGVCANRPCCLRLGEKVAGRRPDGCGEYAAEGSAA